VHTRTFGRPTPHLDGTIGEADARELNIERVDDGADESGCRSCADGRWPRRHRAGLECRRFSDPINGRRGSVAALLDRVDAPFALMAREHTDPYE
jgi:hypothetical protein